MTAEKAVGSEGCSTVQLDAKAGGFARLALSYKYNDLVGTPLALRDEVTVGAYEPLAPIQPKSELVLAIDSSADIVWVGGPHPWLNNPENHFHQVSTCNQAIEY